MASYQNPVLKIQKQHDKIIRDKDVQTQLWRIDFSRVVSKKRVVNKHG